MKAHNRSVNADAQSRSAAAPRLSLVAGYVRRYEGKAFGGPSKTSLPPHSARVGALVGTSQACQHGCPGGRKRIWPLSQSRSMVLCTGRTSRATAPASLAHVVGTARVGTATALAASNMFGLRAVFAQLLFASPGAVPHNRSIHTDAQVHRAAQRRLFMGAGDLRR